MQAKQIQGEIYAQLKDISGLNWIQKEYLNQYSKLPTKQKEVVIETLLEHQRRGNFVRVYPTKNSDFYDCFLSHNKSNQQALYHFLYSEVFLSFKDATNTKNLFNGWQTECDSGSRRKPRGSGLAIYAENNGSKIAKELLYEYFSRVLALLREARVARFSDCQEMQEILGKLSLVLKDDCLRFDEDLDEDSPKSKREECGESRPGSNAEIQSKERRSTLGTKAAVGSEQERAESAQEKAPVRRGSQVPTLEAVIGKLTEKNKKIHQYVRKIALLELRKQAQRTTVAYSNVPYGDIPVSESKIKAYLSGSSQKILQQCQ